METFRPDVEMSGMVIDSEPVPSTPEAVRALCLLNQLVAIKRGESEGPPQATVQQEKQRGGATETQLHCGKCSARCIVNHTNWEIDTIRDVGYGPYIADCPDIDKIQEGLLPQD